MAENLHAINQLVDAYPALKSARHAPIVTLARVLARQMDSMGEAAPTRLSAAYLSALKDLNRALAEIERPTNEPASPKLDRLRSITGGKAN